MNTTLARDRLRDPLAQAKAATHPRDETCRLVLARCAADGTLTLQGTDKESACTLTVREVAVEEPGACLLPDMLGSILGTAPAGDVQLRMRGDKLFLVTLPGTDWEREYDLPTAPVDGFPEVAAPEGEPQVECAAADLRTALERVEFAAAESDGKYAMRGILFDRKGDKLNLAATDGKSLAVADLVGVPRAEFPKGNLLVPKKAAGMALKLLADLDPGAVCGVSFGMEGGGHGTTWTLTTPAGSVWSRLVEGKFPLYRKVIPKDEQFNFKVPLIAGAFREAVKAAAVVTDDESQRVEFVFVSGRVTMQASGATTGKGKVPLALPDYSGDEVKVSVDPMYLTRFFRVLDEGEAVELRIVDGQKSIVFSYSEGRGLCLIVPLV